MVTTGGLFGASAAIGKIARQFFFLTVFLVLFTTPLWAQDLVWPTQLSTDTGEITLYQPQLDSFEKNIVEGRMALSYTEANKEPLFGALWFRATLHTDLDSRTATLATLTIPELRFPDMEDSVSLQVIKDHIIQEVQRINPVIAIDSIVAELNHDLGSGGEDLQLNNTPPDICFRDKPTLLVTIDGEPIWMDVADGRLEAVRNTPFFIVREKETSSYYLSGGGFWYVSAAISNGWTVTDQVPGPIRQFAEKNVLQDVEMPETVGKAPDLLVVTHPSELIVVNGKAEYVPIKETQLLYVENTESDLIFSIPSQTYYLLLSGRWYASQSLQGKDWRFVEPKDIPADFAKIPDKSDMADVRVSVPGTPEARDAYLSQFIPQTVVVDRKTATVAVRYDGKPVFQAIPGTAVSYALNTSQSVLEINGVYYAVADGVWYIAVTANGPWQVATERPGEVDAIPIHSPVYNVKYVYIYDYTPDVVYMGYLPGYTYSYIYSGLVVYGSGFYYRPWYRSYYYPRPLTWGFGVRYNSYIGWGFSVDYCYSWMSWGYHPFPRYWGPRGYYPGLKRGASYGAGHHRRGDWGSRERYGANYRQNHYNNIYRKGNRPGIKTWQVNKEINRTLNKKQIRPNNRYVDQSGNVYRKDGTSWYRENNHVIQQGGKRPVEKLSGEQVRKGQKWDTKTEAVERRPSSSNQVIQQGGKHPVEKLSGEQVRKGQKRDTKTEAVERRPSSSNQVIQQGGKHPVEKLSGEQVRKGQKWDTKTQAVEKRPSSSDQQQLQGSEWNRIRGNNSYQNYQRNRSPSAKKPDERR
ncbi:MAG: DUF4198 domain-containing protein [Proteobacteria bacterium]|nr:DUF4198 domain-containing protein [Pseudomonadota bacterium]